MSRFFKALVSPQNKPTVFYILAFVPLVLIVYYQPGWPFAVISPAYGFILLTIKRPSFFAHHGANSIQKAIGITILFGSFFLYYPLVSLFPRAAYYSVANYVTYILGLTLTFFEISALKEAFTSIFLIVAATVNSLLFAWLEPLLTPYIHHFVSLMSIILKTLGMNVTTQYPDILIIHTFEGPIASIFSWGCVAGSSIVFSIILVVFLIEERTTLRTTLSWAFIGIFGTLIVNIIRLTIIFLSYHFYGFEVGEKVHYVIGYALFITWLLLFFYIFSRRQAVLRKIQLIRHKLSWIHGRTNDGDCLCNENGGNPAIEAKS